jgi:hypothetical protein
MCADNDQRSNGVTEDDTSAREEREKSLETHLVTLVAEIVNFKARAVKAMRDDGRSLEEIGEQLGIRLADIVLILDGDGRDV